MWTESWLEEGEEKAVEAGGREGRKGREMGDRREEGDREGIERLGRKGKSGSRSSESHLIRYVLKTKQPVPPPHSVECCTF